jgi:hypothetical protein
MLMTEVCHLKVICSGLVIVEYVPLTFNHNQMCSSTKLSPTLLYGKQESKACAWFGVCSRNCFMWLLFCVTLGSIALMFWNDRILAQIIINQD